MDLSGVEDTPSGGRRRVSRVDEKYKKWRQNSLMIWNKIADHRKGNTFLRKIKDDNYYKLIKEPMTLEMVKTRIREGVRVFPYFPWNIISFESSCRLSRQLLNSTGIYPSYLQTPSCSMTRTRKSTPTLLKSRPLRMQNCRIF